jgi:hypothetical protein
MHDLLEAGHRTEVAEVVHDAGIQGHMAVAVG